MSEDIMIAVKAKKAPHKILTLATKKEVLEEYQRTRKSERALARQFDCSKTQIHNILCKQVEIQSRFESSADLYVTRKRVNFSTKNHEINRLTLEWFRRAKMMNVAVTGPMLQQKARMFAQALQINDFFASNGWLASFRSRHNIKLGQVTPKDPLEVRAPFTASYDWKQRIKLMSVGYEADNIYNCDETALLWRCTPDERARMGNEDMHNSKERVTILLCVNYSGTDRRKLLVVGRSVKPGTLKAVDKKKLPVTWRYNSRAWMTANIFKDWLAGWNRSLARSDRKVLVFLDTAPCHPDAEFSNIKLAFMPPGTAPDVQPLGHGIVRNFKAKYRRKMVEMLTGTADKEVSVLDACLWSARAWEDVTAKTVFKSFTRCGFEGGYGAVEVDCEEDVLEGEDGERFVVFDDEVETCGLGENWEQEMLDGIQGIEDTLKEASEEESEDEGEFPDPELMVTTTEALTCIRKLKSYALRVSDVQLYAKVDEIHVDVSKKRLEETGRQITD